MNEKLSSLPGGVQPMLLYLGGDRPISEFVIYDSLEQAKRDPKASMYMEADDGGQMLLACVVNIIRASERSLNRLLADLTDITWGGGLVRPIANDDDGWRDGSRMHLSNGSIRLEPSVIRDDMRLPPGVGMVIDGIWTDREFRYSGDLLIEIRDVILGRKEVIDLPNGYRCQKRVVPDPPEFSTILAAQQADARIGVCHPRIWFKLLMSIYSKDVHCSDAVFIRMLEDIDQAIPPTRAVADQPRYHIQLTLDTHCEVRGIAWQHRSEPYVDFEVYCLRDQILSILAGRQERIDMPAVPWWA